MRHARIFGEVPSPRMHISFLVSRFHYIFHFEKSSKMKGSPVPRARSPLILQLRSTYNTILIIVLRCRCTSTPYVSTSATLPTHKIRQPHCSNSLSNGLSVKERPQVVIDRHQRYVLLHLSLSRGVEKLRFDFDTDTGVMMHFQHGLQMNSWTYSATELVCRRQLKLIPRAQETRDFSYQLNLNQEEEDKREGSHLARRLV